MATNVLGADDHQIIRQGLRLLVAGQQDRELIGEAENGRQARELAEQLRPDVAVMDVSMPDMDGFEATRILHTSHPEIAIIALSMHNDQIFIEGMKTAGAVGYVLKDAAFEELATAIRAAMAGETYFPN